MGMRHQTVEMGGGWADCVGTMDRRGVVFVWGNSGNGKSSAVISLCKELAAFGKVLYVSLEEGYSLSLQNTLRRFDMQECGGRFRVISSVTLDALTELLSRPRSPQFVVIDSIQYMQLTYKQYIALKERFAYKLFVLVSHADGKQPEGRAARSIKYDAMLKLWVEGYTVFSKGRFIGRTGENVIWKDGAEEYWKGNEKVKSNI